MTFLPLPAAASILGGEGPQESPCSEGRHYGDPSPAEVDIRIPAAREFALPRPPVFPYLEAFAVLRPHAVSTDLQKVRTLRTIWLLCTRCLQAFHARSRMAASLKFNALLLPVRASD